LRWLRGLIVIAMLAAPAGARAETADVPYDGLTFNNAKHRLWYARFWTGHCTGLSLFVCFSGKPYWNETMRRLVAAASPEQRPALTAHPQDQHGSHPRLVRRNGEGRRDRSGGGAHRGGGRAPAGRAMSGQRKRAVRGDSSR
jgi:hypothetical protein